MGCDIHTMAEIYRAPWTMRGYGDRPDVEVPGHWDAIKHHMFDNLNFNADRPIAMYNVPTSKAPYQGRNYSLFSWLAGVRNYNERLIPLDEPRGVPKDASKGWRKYTKRWGADLHSMSFFTLEELLASEEKARTYTYTETGVITLEQYRTLKNGVLPEWWSLMSSTKTILDSDYEAASESALQNLIEKENGRISIETSWERPLWDSVSEFYEKSVERMKNLLPYVKDNPAHVRLVFGFDN